MLSTIPVRVRFALQQRVNPQWLVLSRDGDPPSAWAVVYARRRTAGSACEMCLGPRRLTKRRPFQGPLLCRFLGAGVTRGATCSGGRRPKSARARSRGEVWAAGGSQRYGDLIFALVMVAGAKLAPGDLARVWRGAWRRATGIAGVAGSVSTGDRLVDWRGCGERDRRQRGASATERESGGADRRSGS